MDEEVLRLEFGDGALVAEDKSALFKVAGNLCASHFGAEHANRSLRDSIEQVETDGKLVRISRLVIRNLGCLIGSIIEIQYFEPTNEVYRPEDEDEDCDDNEEDLSFYGKHYTMTFDTSDGTFFKSETRARLEIDLCGQVELEEIEMLDPAGESPVEHEINHAFEALIHSEAATPTTDDYFIVNTVELMLRHRIK